MVNSTQALTYGLDSFDTIQFNGYTLSATVARDLGDGADPETTGAIIISDISNPVSPVENLIINRQSNGITRIDSPRDVEFIEIGSNLYVAWAQSGHGGHIAKLNVTGSGADINVALEDEVEFSGNYPTRLEGE